MSLVAVQNGLGEFLTAIGGLNLQMGLYSNNHAPSITDVLSDYTAASFGGYAGLVTMTGLTSPSFDGTGQTVTWDPMVWTCDGTGSGNVYGYYVWNATSNQLLWAELDPAGVAVLSANGQTYTVLPKLRSEDL